MADQNSEGMFVYVGTYTRSEPHVEGKSQGILVYRLDSASGALRFLSAAGGIANPSFLALHPDGGYLYAVNEVADSGSGAVSAFAVDRKTGALTFLNRQSSKGPGPCHLSVDATGRYVLVANYTGGSVAILPIRDDGGLGEATDFVQHEGASVNPNRQKGPHAHSITLDPGNRYAFAADLGIDKVLIYRLDLERGRLIPNEQPWAQVHPGAGPRHFAFHPGGEYAYLINELDNTVVAFAYNAGRGVLDAIQTLSTLPEGYAGTSYCADIHASPSGKHLYGSNRGHDSIAIFEIDAGTGRLTLLDCEPTQGEFPRNFGIDPTGSLLLAANQNTDNIVPFKIDPRTGSLEPTSHITEAPTPVCVKFLPALP